MSYGSKLVESASLRKWTREDGSSSQNSISQSRFFDRSGTNRNMPFANARKKKNKRAKFTIVRESFRKTILRRIANPDYPDSSSKRYLYFPTSSLRWRVKKIPLPNPRDSELTRLKVNDLNYVKEDFQEFPCSRILITPFPGSSYSPEWIREISGSTGYLGSSFPYGWGYGSPSVFHPDSYSVSNLPIDFQSIVSRLTEAATRKIYSKAKDQSVNLQNFLAEIKSAKDSFGGIVQRLSKTLLLLKKGRLKQATSTLLPHSSRDVANDVLLFNFGIAPLLSDIDGMMKHLAQNTKDSVVTVIAKSSDTVSSIQTGTVSSSILYRRETISINTKISVRAELSYKVDLPAVQQLIQLGFTNPATTAWEVTPWSFVIDWIIPIGDYLDSLDSWAMLQPVSFHTTVFIEQDVLCTAVHDGVSGSSDYKTITTGGPSSWSKKMVYCSRKSGALGPPPIPRVKSPVSSSHIVNAMALLRQLKF